MNLDLLRSVQRAISRAPDRFCAAQWAFARNANQVLTEGASPVGFRCCIAGHVLLESGTFTEGDLLREGGFHTGGALWDEAATALGLADPQCRELFFPSQWVHPFKKKYYLCAQEEEAQVATAYLDYFAQKHGGPDADRTSATRSVAATDRSPRGSGAADRTRTPVTARS